MIRSTLAQVPPSLIAYNVTRSPKGWTVDLFWNDRSPQTRIFSELTTAHEWIAQRIFGAAQATKAYPPTTDADE